MASMDTLSVVANDSASCNEHNGEAKEQLQLQISQVEVDMSKPSRPAPKMFASPRKKSEATHGTRARRLSTSFRNSLKAKLRKALAPYLTSSYLQAQMAKQFTKDFLSKHPPPENEEDLPGYVQQHLSELNRVTENWTGCVGRALDQFMHDSEVEERLQRMRAREEGRWRPPPPAPDTYGERQSTADDEVNDMYLDPDSDLVATPTGSADGGLTPAQLFGAVHLVSDVKVWQEILAAQKAEERRQHAIAELHMHHAARIIQRSWRGFIDQRKEEKARLDALVSPDVQAMLSAAAYKAMRDARNKLSIMKIRKSLSRKYQGFGSATPRDLDAVTARRNSGGMRTPSPTFALTPLRASMQSGDMNPGRQDGQADGVRASGNVHTSGSGVSRSSSPSRLGLLPRTLTSVQSFEARSQHIIYRLVSMKDLVEAPFEDGEVTGVEGRASGEQQGGARGGDSSRSRTRGRVSNVEALTKPTSADAGHQDGGKGPRRHPHRRSGGSVEAGSRWSSGTAVSGRPGEGDEADTEGPEGEEEDEEDDDDFVFRAVAAGAAGAAGALDGSDSDSVCASGSDADDGETAEAAMAEAEEVVQVAAKLAKAVLRPHVEGDSSSEASGPEDGEASIGRLHMGDEALEALSAMEAAASAAGGRASGSTAVSSLLAPSPLRVAAQATGYEKADKKSGAGSGRGREKRSPVHRGESMAAESVTSLRQLIAGALAAAASPVLGRKNALAVAQLGFGDLLQLPGAKALLPKAAAAAMAEDRAKRSTSQGQTAEVPLASFGHMDGANEGGPLEIRAAAAPVKMVLRGAKVAGGGGGSGSARRYHFSDSGAPPAASAASAALAAVMAEANKGLRGSGRRSITGDIVQGLAIGVPSARQMPIDVQPLTLPAVHVPAGLSPSASDFPDPMSPTSARLHARALFGYYGNSNGNSAPLPTYTMNSSPTGISAAAAAARATQPWASPRRHRPPPGAHTIMSSLPDPRLGMGASKDSATPREPTWLLPPISRSATGPATLGGALPPVLMVQPALGAAGRAPSDPNMQRPLGLHGAGAGGVGGGGHLVLGLPGAMAAAGRARGCAVDSSLQHLQQHQQHSGAIAGDPPSPWSVMQQATGFTINSLNAGGATQRTRLGFGGTPPPPPPVAGEGAAVQHQQHPYAYPQLPLGVIHAHALQTAALLGGISGSSGGSSGSSSRMASGRQQGVTRAQHNTTGSGLRG